MDSQECAICMNEFSRDPKMDNSKTAPRFSCLHSFCKSCDAKLQINGHKCPLCRASRKRMVRVGKKLIPISDDQRLRWVYVFAELSTLKKLQTIREMVTNHDGIVSISNNQTSVITIDTYNMSRYDFEKIMYKMIYHKFKPTGMIPELPVGYVQVRVR